MQSETGFPSSHQLKSYVASKSRLKLAARAVLSADAGLLVYIFKHKTFLATKITQIYELTAQYFTDQPKVPYRQRARDPGGIGRLNSKRSRFTFLLRGPPTH